MHEQQSISWNAYWSNWQPDSTYHRWFTTNVSEPTGPDQHDSSEPTADQYLNDQTPKIEKCRADAYAAHVSQAERMVKRSRLDLKSACVAGENIAVPIPMVDRGTGDPRNILGVIINRDKDKD